MIKFLNNLYSFIFVKKLSDIGERKAIDLISRIVDSSDWAVDIGDDCAAYEIGDQYLLVSSDMISAKNHIPNVMNPWQIGWFIVAVNISDVVSKGGRPIGFVLSLGMPGETKESFFRELMQGVNSCSKKYGCPIVGGDTKETSEITLCGAVLGLVDKKNFMSRKGCRLGDVVAVTGSLGGAGAGFYTIKNNIKKPGVWKGLLEPKPKMTEGKILSDSGLVNCCMDISDGLSSSLYQLSKKNNVGFEIFKKEIPVSSSLKELKNLKKADLDYFVLHFGGDYELLLTVDSEHFDDLKELIRKNDGRLTGIGRVTKDKRVKIVDKDSKILENKGYEHFK
jgi:thiamine-monophosphate kinase